MEKDLGWKEYFNDNARYADVINGIGCNGEQLVKASDIEELDTASKQKNRDIIRKVALGTSFAIVGVENQEEMDYGLPLRIMYYDIAQYQKQKDKIKKEVRNASNILSAGEYLYGFKKDSRLNPIVTLVLYSGEDMWEGATSLHDILNFEDIPEHLQKFVSDYKINVVDIRKFENTDVFKTDVKQVFDFIRYSRDKEKLLELVENDEYYQNMEDDAFRVVSKYTRSKELIQIKNYEDNGGKKNVCKAIRDLMDDSLEKGAFLTTCEFLADGSITLETALKKTGFNKEDFIKKAKEYEFDVEKFPL